jgi:hypothetical protein
LKYYVIVSTKRTRNNEGAPRCRSGFCTAGG